MGAAPDDLPVVVRAVDHILWLAMSQRAEKIRISHRPRGTTITFVAGTRTVKELHEDGRLDSSLLPWSVAGSYYEVCNCEAICPCRRQAGGKGGRPSYATCDFALSWWIERGCAGAIELAGLKVVMAGRWETTPGDPWRVTLYVDERATPAQKDALAAVFLGRAGGQPQAGFGGNIVEVYDVKSAQIELDHTRASERIEIAPYLTVRTREAVGHDFTVSCGIPGHDHPGQEIVADVFRYQDPPLDWEFRGKCGFATDFAYAS